MDKYDAAVAPIPGEPLARQGLEIDDIVSDNAAALCSGQLKDLRIQKAQVMTFVQRDGVASLAPKLDRDGRIDVFVQEESGHTYPRSSATPT